MLDTIPTQELTFVQSLKPKLMELSRGGSPVLTITSDGFIEVGAGYTPTEAGDFFIEMVLRPAVRVMIAQERALTA